MIELDNLARPMARGIIELPKTQIAHIEQQKKESLEFGKEKNKKIEPILASTSALYARYHLGRLDLSYTLMADHHGEIKANAAIGRLWSMHYPNAWNFSDGGTFPVLKMELAPAFAGFKHGLQDQAALRALSAMSSSLRSTANEMIPDDARATINSLLARPAQLSRMLLRFASLWAATAATELAGGVLECHSTADDRQSVTISTLGDFTIALKSIMRQQTQPLLVNVRGSAEGLRYMRIARILCLDKPILALENGAEPPSVASLWPRIANARAYQLAPAEQTTSLAGPISSRDVAVLASYYARCLNAGDQLEDWVQFAASMVYRPAGSALMGRHQAAILQLPKAELGPTILMPLVQAVDTLDDESIMGGMDEPAGVCLYGACQAAVFLSALNNISQTALGDAAGHLTGHLKTRSLLHQRNLAVRSMDGTPMVCAALALASQQGWARGFSEAWLALSPMSDLCLGTYFPIEAEECMPWVDALPSSCAMLGTLLPVHLNSMPTTDSYLRVSEIQGRVGLTDALYGLLALGAQPRIFHSTLTRGWPKPPDLYTVKTSYRGSPTDGQFSPHRLDDTTWQPLFRLETHAGIIKAVRGHEARSLWRWHYEWMIPYSSDSIIAQYVTDATTPQLPPVAGPPTPQESTTVGEPGPPTVYPAGPVDGPDTLRNDVGDTWGPLLDSRNAVQAMIGQRVESRHYETVVRGFAGHIIGLPIDQLGHLVAPHKQAAVWTWVHNYASEAAAWTTAPAMQAECQRVAEYALTQLNTDMPEAPPPTIETRPILTEASLAVDGPPVHAEEPPAMQDFPVAQVPSVLTASTSGDKASGQAGSRAPKQAKGKKTTRPAGAEQAPAEPAAPFSVQDVVFEDPQAQ